MDAATLKGLSLLLEPFPKIELIILEEEQECVMCLEMIKQGSQLKCKHIFHDDCLNEWLREFKNCPICKN